MKKRIRLIQISNGVGSGNIGDELMAQEFWKLLPANVVLEVSVLPEAVRYRGVYPAPHRYVDGALRPAEWFDVPGLLVGDTPVAEFEGLQYPLRTVGPAISRVTQGRLPVDAIAVGVDRLHSPEARQLFAVHYAGIRSWTVRSEACRDALLDLGVAPERIHVAADLAWLFTPGAETDPWAAEVWRQLGVDTERPLLVVNAVHHHDPANIASKQAIAAALDQLANDHGYQIAFLHNESRTGPYFDMAATADIRAALRAPAVEVPTEYYTPQEMVSLLRSATTVLSQRYHMAIQAILAGTIPVCLMRGQKLSGLAREFDLPTAVVETGAIVDSVRQAAARRPERLTALARKREEHRIRAGEALHFVRQYWKQGAPARKAAIRQLAIIHLGGLGDLVLASSLVEALRQKHGKAEIHLLCRAPFVKLAALFPSPPDKVVPIPMDPNAYAEPAAALKQALQEVFGALRGLRPDIVISAELEPTWLSWYLASRWQAPLNLACTRLQAPRGLLPILLHEAGLEAVQLEGPAWHPELIEGERYAQLAKAAGAPPCRPPEWAIHPEQEEQTAGFLASNGIGGEYAICFPLGAATTLVKRWPRESFALALSAATERFSIPVLLTGEEHERAALEEHAADLRQRGATVVVFGGTGNEIGLLAGLLARAKFFLGNDTGPAHLAQAYGTPGVVVFGGGTWPHYRPWGPGAVGVVHPMACFGCRWDCAFGQPICISGVTVDSVVGALERVKAHPAAEAEVVIVGDASAEVQLIAGCAAKQYREAQDDRLARHRAWVETEYARAVAEKRSAGLADELAQVRAHNRVSFQELTARLTLLDGRMAAAVSAAAPAVESATVWRTAAEERLERLQELSKTYELVEAESVNRAQALEQMDRLFRESEASRAQAQEAANQRLALIETISRELEELRRENAARLSAMENANVLLQRQQNEIAELREGYAARLVAIEEANALLRRQQSEIAELREGHAARLVAIEEANGLLQAQQSEIARQASRAQEMEKAAAERLAALEHANQLLAAANTAREVQDQRLRVFEQAAAERLTALETTAAALRRESERRAQLVTDLETVAAAQAVASRRQSEERERWQTVLASLRAEVSQERAARLAAEGQLVELRAALDRVATERDRYRRSTEELAFSEQDLRRQILAAESETLLQSVFRKVRGKST